MFKKLRPKSMIMDKNSYPYLNYLFSNNKPIGGGGVSSAPYHSFASYYCPSSMPNPLNNSSGGSGNHNHLQYPQNNGTNNCPSNTSSPSSMNRRSTSKNPNGPPPPPPPPTLPSHHRPSSSSYRRPIYSIANPNYSPYRSGRPPPQQSSNSYLKLHPTHNYPRYYSTSYPYCLSSSSSLPLQSSFTTFNTSVKLQQLGNRLQSWKTASIVCKLLSYINNIYNICVHHTNNISFYNFFLTTALDDNLTFRFRFEFFSFHFISFFDNEKQK